ncbi:PadR family transcriptional regulator [Desulfoscipio sp. XC116]|uniref:PadR family transcriptional regulator n=1 Tax=Desulfoscipio sp. XC116 TaxID=3144975 RepID=UPI00325B59E2
MDKRIRRFYAPMTETSFYILFALQDEMHGYSIMQYVKELTNGEIILGAGTVYTSLSKMEKDGLITLVKSENKRKIYKITGLGNEVLDFEIRRIERLYRNTRTRGER